MDVIVAAIGFPGVFLLLAAGWGLLVDRLAGRCLHGALVLPVGFAAIVAASQLLTRKDGVSDTTPYVVLVVGLGGLVAGWPRIRRLREGAEPALAFLGAYAIAIAPVLLSGRPTLTAYLRDTTPGTHVAGAYGLIQHGASFAGGPQTSDANQMRGYFDNAYPSGGHTALAAVGELFPTDLLWLFQPFLALALAIGAPALWLLARRLGAGRVLAVVAAVVASVPAITYAYALQGSIKEMALLPVLAAIPALLAAPEAWLARGWRGTVPLAVLGGGAIGAVGVAAGPWVAAGFVIGGLLVLARTRRRGFTRVNAAVALGALAAVFLVTAAPAVSHVVASINVARSFSESNPVAASDPGNLFGPLHAVQVLGVWLFGDQRALPDVHLGATYQLIGIVLLGVAFGVVELWRRRAWTTLAWVAGMALIWWVLTRRGTIWTDAKLIVLTAPMAVFLAFIGASALRRTAPVLSAVLAGFVSLGVLWSDAILYHETNLLPTSRYEEAQAIDKQFAGRGPAWVPDFDEFLLPALRRTHIMSPGMAFDPEGVGIAANGQFVGYGMPEDLDDAPLPVLEQQPLVIERNSPERSRPPLNYELVHSGQWQVWQRRKGPAPLAHLGANGDGDPTGVPACRDVRALAAQARAAHGELVVARRQRTFVRDLGQTDSSANWPRSEDYVALVGPGQLTTEIRVPKDGVYKLWLRGDIARPVTIQVDGRTIGSVGYQSGGIGSYIMPVTARLTAGRHTFRMARGGGSLRPGDGGVTLVRRLVVEPASRPIALERLPASRGRSLCGERVDWIEAAPKP